MALTTGTALVACCALWHFDSNGNPSVPDSLLSEIHGASNKHPAKKKDNLVLYTNCADLNRGGMTEVASCWGVPNSPQKDCLYCAEAAVEPLVDETTTTKDNGYERKTQDVPCTGLVYKGVCLNGQCKNGSSTTLQCDVYDLKAYLQQTPPGDQ
jgi:hypothetical protein